ncbi:DUF58 domain-containing protein [Paenibacillus sp. GCM10027627]|uniref:DUF58 domain-containing protein n=1 Tax=unclassified Paenibacillus TaxID=185978 RepID=UPI003645ED58
MREQTRYRTRRTAWALIAIAFAAAAVSVVARGGAVEWFFFALLAGIALPSIGLPLWAARGLTAERAPSSAVAEEGGEVCISLSLTRKWPIPFLWGAVRECAVNECGVKERTVEYRTLFVPMFSRKVTLEYALKGLSRGIYRLETVEVTFGDWLGLTAVTRTFPLATQFAVVPSFSKEGPDGKRMLDRASNLSSYSHSNDWTASSDWEAELETVPHGQAGHGFETRPYRDGDPIRHLDFRAAARGRGFYTKIRSGGSPRHSLVLIDRYGPPYGEENRLFDACIRGALHSVYEAAVSGGETTAATDEWTHRLSGASGKELLERLEELAVSAASIHSTKEGDVLGTVLERELSGLSKGTIAIFTGDWQNTQRWNGIAERFSVKGIVLELHLFVQSAVLTFAMREQERLLSQAGIRVRWAHVANRPDAHASTGGEEGAYALG